MSFERIAEGVMTGNKNLAIEVINEMIEAGTEPLAIINQGLMGGMNVVGERFKNGEMFVPEVLMAARAMNAGIDIVKPLINEDDMPNEGTIVIGTVKGDLHDIGKNLVAMMMESAGFNVINIGIDKGPEAFVEAVQEHDADIVAMSAMLTTTMINMKGVIDGLAEAGLRDKVKVMIGGAPVTDKFSGEISADLYTVDASSASTGAKALVS